MSAEGMDSVYHRPQWTWGEAVTSNEASSRSAEAGRHAEDPHQEPEQPGLRQPRRYYKSRTCRICLEVVEPIIEIEESATGLFAAKERVKYVSEDDELGRLISPCKCKGSQKYVHEGCLQAWRNSAPMSDRNFWKCPTCGFQYRIQRLSWGRWLQSKVVRMAATVAIMIAAVFLLGFIANPIINLWTNPGRTLTFFMDPIGLVADHISDLVLDIDGPPLMDDLEPTTWSYHFLKGFLSLGLLGFVKSFFAMTPWQWFNVRWGVRGNRRGGRDRLHDINWIFVVIGIFTFLAATWKVVSLICSRALEKLNGQIVDINGDEPEDADEDDAYPTRNAAAEELRKDV